MEMTDDGELDNDNDAAADILMTPEGFEFLVSDLKMSETTKLSTKLVLVDGLSRKEVRQQTGISSDTLSRALKRIDEHTKEKLQAEGLVMTNHITLPSLADGVADVELDIIRTRMKTKRKAQKKDD